MNERKNNKALKLVSNKLFITLMVFALGVIMVSAVFTRNSQSVSHTDVAEEEIAVVEDEIILEPDPVVVETETVEEVEKIEDVAVHQEEEQEVFSEVIYTTPLSGELQKEFSVDELLWDETMEDWRTHCGIDISAKVGEEVDTAGTGTVVEVSETEKYGITVKVEHPDGVISVYKNLGKAVVNVNEILDEGQMIGTVGDSATFECGQKPHLHFEMIYEEKYVNPLNMYKFS